MVRGNLSQEKLKFEGKGRQEWSAKALIQISFELGFLDFSRQPKIVTSSDANPSNSINWHCPSLEI